MEHSQELVTIRIPVDELTSKSEPLPIEEKQAPPHVAATSPYLLYAVHLIDGTIIQMLEDPSDSAIWPLPERVATHSDEDLLCIGDQFNGIHFVPRRSILYISQADVPRIEEVICPFRLFNIPPNS